MGIFCKMAKIITGAMVEGKKAYLNEQQQKKESRNKLETAIKDANSIEDLAKAKLNIASDERRAAELKEVADELASSL